MANPSGLWIGSVEYKLSCSKKTTRDESSNLSGTIAVISIGNISGSCGVVANHESLSSFRQGFKSPQEHPNYVLVESPMARDAGLSNQSS